jgi:hypothetical protein
VPGRVRRWHQRTSLAVRDPSRVFRNLLCVVEWWHTRLACRFLRLTARFHVTRPT